MTAMPDFRRLLLQALPPLLWTLVTLYFGYHLVQGDRGLIAFARLHRDVERTQAVLAEISADRKVLEQRVRLMEPGQLDPDMLDQQIRKELGLADPDEIVVFEPR